MTISDLGASIRPEYPALQSPQAPIYFDSAATGLIPKRVIERLTRFQKGIRANTHRSTHQYGQSNTEMLEKARQTVASFIGCQPEEVIWTRGTTDSFNLLISLLMHNGYTGQSVWLSDMEHHSNLIPWFLRREDAKLQIHQLHLSEELPDWKSLTGIVSLIHVSNVLGVINPLETWFPQIQNAFKIVDAAQSAPHGLINWSRLNTDALAFSGHKMGSPGGIGVLVLKKEYAQKWTPVFGGGGTIHEFSWSEGPSFLDPPLKFEGGTPPFEGIIGLEEAILFHQEIGFDRIREYEHRLKQALLEDLTQIPDIIIHSDRDSSVPIVTFSFPQYHHEDLGFLLNQHQICVRTGKHCANPLAEYRQFPFQGSLRVSLSIFNTFEEIEYFGQVLRKCLKILG